MQKTRSPKLRGLLSRAACVGLVLVSPAAAGTGAAPLGPSPLGTARTIQVTETRYDDQAKTTHQLAPSERSDIRIAGRNLYVLMTHLAHSVYVQKSSRPNLLVNNGEALYEYDGAKNQYHKAVSIDPAQTFSDSDPLQFQLVEQFGLVLHPDSVLAPDSMRTVVPARLNGKPMQLISETTPIVFGAQKITRTQQLYLDAGTGLPYRFEDDYTQNGVTRSAWRIDYSHWVLNQPLPASSFVFVPPAGAVEHLDHLLPVGSPAPDFTALDPDGKTVHLSDYRGKTVVLDFWATWCKPCQAYMPHVESVYNHVKDQNVVVLAVCVWDKKTAYQNWLTKTKGLYTFQTIFDPAADSGKGQISEPYGVTGIPATFVIDKNGKIVAAINYAPGDTGLEQALVSQGATP